MMRSERIPAIVSFYLFLLSGRILSGFVYSENHIIALISELAFGTVATLIAEITMKTYKNDRKTLIHPRVKLPLAIILSVIVLVVCLDSFANIMSDISDEYSTERFEYIFVLLTIALCVYAVKKSDSAFRGISMVVFPFIVFSMLLTLLSTKNISEGFTDTNYIKTVGKGLRDFTNGLIIVPEILYLTLFHRSRTGDNSSMRGVPMISFLLYAGTVISEYIKALLVFGYDGMSHIERPFSTLLALVPFMNVQELFLPVLFFAHVTRLLPFVTVLCDGSVGICCKGKKNTAFYFVSALLAVLYPIYRIYLSQIIGGRENIVLICMFLLVLFQYNKVKAIK